MQLLLGNYSGRFCSRGYLLWGKCCSRVIYSGADFLLWADFLEIVFLIVIKNTN
ncbi:MAG: hypothetical protein KBC30_10135 [Planctomycetes bacterium]|nr:hypothetical protein [Planctomycetota bacterium]HNZ66120.1 hypothetical protein [Planctomycetota bacterium]HPY75556.1 hypothetical protein [Planctomycetota bacterium]HQB01150.1 hypothetical protein [Planctomycetota bacterium]